MPNYLLKPSSVEDSDAESSVVEFETTSEEVTLSLSEAADLSSVGFLECQYIMLAVRVSIIF